MNLITDRQETDVLLGTPKGSYGAEDLNRVEQAVEQLQQRMTQMDLYPGLLTKTDWAAPGNTAVPMFPTQVQMARYLHNVKMLCSLLGIGATLPDSMERLTYADANAIELALQQADLRTWGIINEFRYSGEGFAGEENGL